jgi:hypothetical protein
LYAYWTVLFGREAEEMCHGQINGGAYHKISSREPMTSGFSPSNVWTIWLNLNFQAKTWWLCNNFVIYIDWTDMALNITIWMLKSNTRSIVIIQKKRCAEEKKVAASQMHASSMLKQCMYRLS